MSEFFTNRIDKICEKFCEKFFYPGLDLVYPGLFVFKSFNFKN